MTNDAISQLELIRQLESIKHPNIQTLVYPAGKRLESFEKGDDFYPLSQKTLVLFKLYILNGTTIFNETSEFVFLSNDIFITSSMGLEFWYRSDGALDATSSTCKLLYQKNGLKGFELILDEITKEYQLVLNLNDGNAFRSVRFQSEEKIPDNLINLLNQSLEINKWL